jgi:hypothetical protein
MEVLLEEGGLVGVKILHDGSIDALLESNTLSRDGLFLGTLGKECLGVGLLGDSVADEGLVGNLGDIDTCDRDLGRGAESVDLVNALKRNAVDLVGAGDEEEAGLKLLEEDDSLSAETAGEEDEDGAGGDALAELGGLGLLGAHGSLLLFSGVPLELFDH